MEDGNVMINIIYEDNHLLVVEKNHNLLVQADNTNDIDLLTILKKYYDDSLITEVLKDIKDNPLQYLIEPNCFDCEKCILASKCYYNAELELYHKIKLIRSNKKEM